jgi:hypothetical protein
LEDSVTKNLPNDVDKSTETGGVFVIRKTMFKCFALKPPKRFGQNYTMRYNVEK